MRSPYFLISEFLIPLFRDSVSGTNFKNSPPFHDFQKNQNQKSKNIHNLFFSLLQEIVMHSKCYFNERKTS